MFEVAGYGPRTVRGLTPNRCFARWSRSRHAGRPVNGIGRARRLVCADQRAGRTRRTIASGRPLRWRLERLLVTRPRRLDHDGGRSGSTTACRRPRSRVVAAAARRSEYAADGIRRAAAVGGCLVGGVFYATTGPQGGHGGDGGGGEGQRCRHRRRRRGALAAALRHAAATRRRLIPTRWTSWPRGVCFATAAKVAAAARLRAVLRRRRWCCVWCLWWC